MTDTGRKPNNNPEIQNLPGTPTAKLEMRMAGIRHSNDQPPSMGEESEELLDKLTIEWVRSEFNLPNTIEKRCTQFFLRVWDGNWVYHTVKEGLLTYNVENYIVCWQSTPEVVRNAEKVACSFREYNGKKYVVIKVWKAQKS